MRVILDALLDVLFLLVLLVGIPAGTAALVLLALTLCGVEY